MSSASVDDLGITVNAVTMAKLATTLSAMGHPISAETLRNELVKLGFSRQSNRKADEGSKNPDRNAQFEYINAKVGGAQAGHQPVISVDTKKKELIGNFNNGGTDYRPNGDPRRVKVYDFADKKLGKVVPYGVYDVSANTGFQRRDHQRHGRIRRGAPEPQVRCWPAEIGYRCNLFARRN